MKKKNPLVAEFSRPLTIPGQASGQTDRTAGIGAQGVIFFSWYTFDENGNNVWLVGNATYEAGDGTFTFEVQLVTDGEFMGAKTATRLSAGTVQITAIHCNLLELIYDLSAIGLGQATVSIVRLAGLETAGFTCMDYEAKR